MFATIDGMVEAFEAGKLTRRELVGRIGAVVATLAGSSRLALGAPPGKSTFVATGLNHIALRVPDVTKARDFYIRHFGLKVLREWGQQSCFLDCGDHFVALFRGADAGMDHYCYTIKDFDPDRAAQQLKAVGLEPERRENRVYFRDVSGLKVQVSGRDDAKPASRG